ncbi:MAG: FHA domain-containing protein [Pseudomonadota bacterium]
MAEVIHKLCFVDGPVKDISISLQDEKYTLGRGEENSITILDGGMSKRHATIIRAENKFYIEDLNSTNGTYIDGLKLPPNQKYELRHNCRVTFGNSIVIFAAEKLEEERESGTSYSATDMEHTETVFIPRRNRKPSGPLR